MGLPTTIEAIEDEELRLASTFPDVIKQALIKNNGGIECLTSAREGEVWRLYAVKDTRSKKHIIRSANNIERETNSAREWYGFPENGVALGENGGGDYLMILNSSDSIYIWDHETREIIVTTIELIS